MESFCCGCEFESISALSWRLVRQVDPCQNSKKFLKPLLNLALLVFAPSLSVNCKLFQTPWHTRERSCRCCSSPMAHHQLLRSSGIGKDSRTPAISPPLRLLHISLSRYLQITLYNPPAMINLWSPQVYESSSSLHELANS